MSAPTMPAAIGSATVAEIREMLGGLAGNTDRALLVRVNRWFRENGWENAPYQAFRRSADRRVLVDVTNDPRPSIGVAHNGHSYDWYPVRSVREAIDILVIEGVLPVSFSSMYAAGRASLAPERAA